MLRMTGPTCCRSGTRERFVDSRSRKPYGFRYSMKYPGCMPRGDRSRLAGRDAGSRRVPWFAGLLAGLLASTAWLAAQTQLTGTAPLTVYFNGGSSPDQDGDTLTHAWNFGDQTAGASGVLASHLYAAAGTFTARLTVSDGRGGSHSATLAISVTNPAPSPALVLSTSDAEGGEIALPPVIQTFFSAPGCSLIVSNGIAP